MVANYALVFCTEGTNLFTVAVHEIGHALGLGHSTQKSSVMLPFYQSFRSDFKLGVDDINAINELYGKLIVVCAIHIEVKSQTAL